jgi:hypothetical protein
VVLPSAAIGALSIVLAAGLELLGILPRMNQALAQLVSRDGAESFPLQLPGWGIWLAVSLLAFFTAAAMLGTPGSWRRVLLWLSAVVLVAAWAPVLSLAARFPELAAPLVATVWSGICALVYASRHRMPSDGEEDVASSPPGSGS